MQVVQDFAADQPIELTGDGASRSDVKTMPRLTFYLDGAHTPESMATCAHWFADAVAADTSSLAASPGERGSQLAEEPPAQRLVLFNCMQARSTSRTQSTARQASLALS